MFYRYREIEQRVKVARVIGMERAVFQTSGETSWSPRVFACTITLEKSSTQLASIESLCGVPRLLRISYIVPHFQNHLPFSDPVFTSSFGKEESSSFSLERIKDFPHGRERSMIFFITTKSKRVLYWYTHQVFFLYWKSTMAFYHLSNCYWIYIYIYRVDACYYCHIQTWTENIVVCFLITFFFFLLSIYVYRYVYKRRWFVSVPVCIEIVHITCQLLLKVVRLHKNKIMYSACS